MTEQSTPILRVFLNAGHGLNNAHVGSYDDGAVSCYASEAQIVSAVSDRVLAMADDDEANSVTIVPTPECNEACVDLHPRRKDGTPSGHLAFVIDWINENHAAHAPIDVVISLHMNQSEGADGTLVVYDDGAPARRKAQAEELCKVVAATLGTRCRGAATDRKASPRKSVGIVEDTKPAAFLIELGFIDSNEDVSKVRQCGAEAVIAGIEAIRRFR